MICARGFPVGAGAADSRGDCFADLSRAPFTSPVLPGSILVLPSA